METVFGRHVATGRLVSGAYKTEYGDMEDLTNVSKRIEVRTVTVTKRLQHVGTTTTGTKGPVSPAFDCRGSHFMAYLISQYLMYYEHY